MNWNFIIICIILLIILYFYNFRENYNILNWTQPYYLRENKFGYYLLSDSNLNVFWNKSFNNGSLLFLDPLSQNNNIPIKKQTKYGDVTNYLYSEGSNLIFNPYTSNNLLITYNKTNGNIQTIINNIPNYLTINENGSFTWNSNPLNSSVFTIIPNNSIL